MAGQDDAERINGIMSALGKKETENAALRAQLAAQDANAGLAAEVWEPGTRLDVGDDGQLRVYEPPMPQNPNEQSYQGRGSDPTLAPGDDGSAEWAKADLYRQIGFEPDRNPFTED